MLYQVLHKRWTEFQLLLIAVLKLQSQNRCEESQGSVLVEEHNAGQQLSRQNNNIKNSYFHSEMKSTEEARENSRVHGCSRPAALPGHRRCVCLITLVTSAGQQTPALSLCRGTESAQTHLWMD